MAGSSLASLDLLHVPPADGHVAAVLLEAVRQGFGGHRAVGVLLVVRVAILLLLGGGGLGGGLGRGAGTATEHAHDAVGDGMADGDTSVFQAFTLAICLPHPSRNLQLFPSGISIIFLVLLL